MCETLLTDILRPILCTVDFFPEFFFERNHFSLKSSVSKLNYSGIELWNWIVPKISSSYGFQTINWFSMNNSLLRLTILTLDKSSGNSTTFLCLILEQKKILRDTWAWNWRIHPCRRDLVIIATLCPHMAVNYHLSSRLAIRFLAAYSSSHGLLSNCHQHFVHPAICIFCTSIQQPRRSQCHRFWHLEHHNLHEEVVSGLPTQ